MLMFNKKRCSEQEEEHAIARKTEKIQHAKGKNERREKNYHLNHFRRCRVSLKADLR
jgi:hypothetical protein